MKRFINEEKRVQPYSRSAAVGLLIAGTVFASVITTPPPPALAATSQASPVGIGALEANSTVDPIGIPLKAPTLSWQLTSTEEAESTLPLSQTSGLDSPLSLVATRTW